MFILNPRSKSFWIVMLIAVSMLVLLPLLRPGFIVSDDGDWMIIRLSAFTQSLREGQFPVRFLGRLNNGYGYPVSNFLYPGFLYIGSVLKFVGVPFIAAVKLILIASVLGGSLGLFFWLQTFFGIFESGIGALTFLLSPYLMYDIYKRGSVGEVFASAIGVAGFLAVDRPWGKKLLPLIIAVLLISHNTLALLFGAALIGYIIVRRKWDLLFPFIIGIIMASFFWIPALVETRFVAFNKITVSNPRDFAAAGNMLVFSGLGIILAVFLAVRHHAGAHKREFLWFVTIFLLSGFMATAMALPLWNWPLLTRLVQFPYRFLSLWFIAAPWLVASCITDYREMKFGRIIWIVLIASLAIPAGAALLRVHNTNQPEGFYTTNEGTTTVANEYMPLWVEEVPKEHANTRYELIEGRGTVEPITASTETYSLIVRMEEAGTIRLSSVFYPGWGAMIDDRPVEIDYHNPRGLIDVRIPKGEHRLTVQFRETAFRFVMDVLSLFGACLYGMYIWFVSGKRKNFLKSIGDMAKLPIS